MTAAFSVVLKAAVQFGALNALYAVSRSVWWNHSMHAGSPLLQRCRYHSEPPAGQQCSAVVQLRGTVRQPYDLSGAVAMTWSLAVQLCFWGWCSSGYCASPVGKFLAQRQCCGYRLCSCAGTVCEPRPAFWGQWRCGVIAGAAVRVLCATY